MITVTILKNASKEYRGVRSQGHAGFAKRGEDIVCAAVSMLFINTLNSIEALTDDKALMNLVENEKEGLIDCRFSGAVSEKTRLLLDAMVLGLRQVEEQYSEQYIKLRFEEV